ncbi:MAG: hypothetical protein M0036_04590 [Desulfobacteraceae bacterium]|nr:hypothetical protein [Desulfobacteraceae bacterium]
MFKPFYGLMILMTLCSISAGSSALAATQAAQISSLAAQTYVLEKLRHNDLVFMGTTHKQPTILALMAELLPQLKAAGVTHLALEIASDQQNNIDRYLNRQAGPEKIVLHQAIDCSEYRHLLQILATLPQDQRPQVRAVDLPPDRYNGPADRDHWMADGLLRIFQENPHAKILAEMGSLHVLRELRWLPRIAALHRSIQSLVRAQRPDLLIFAIANIIPAADPSCDFGRLLGPLPGITALDVDRRFTGWNLGLTDCMAIEPAEPYELVDGVIVY